MAHVFTVFLWKSSRQVTIKIVNITAKKLEKIVLMKEKMRKEKMQRIRQKSLLQCKNLGLCTQWMYLKQI